MKKSKGMKKELLFCMVSLLACCAVFVGVTFAWFTSTVTNSGNRIQAGKLEVSLVALDEEGTDIAESGDSIYVIENWMPGDSVMRQFQVKNEGTIEIKYNLTFQGLNFPATDPKLADVVDVYIDGDCYGPITNFAGGESIMNGTLAGGLESDLVTVELKFWEGAGGEYQELPLVVDGDDDPATFDVLLFAAQVNATLEIKEPVRTLRPAKKVVKLDEIDSPAIITAAGGTSVTIPETALADIFGVSVDSVEFVLETTIQNDSGFVVEGAETHIATIDCVLTAYKDGDLTAGTNLTSFAHPVEVVFYIGKGLPGTMSVECSKDPCDFLHGTEYDPVTGLLTFETDHFSEFNILCSVTVVKEGESIQAAINAANIGDTIYVCSGLYEENLTISKPLTLLGVNYKENARGERAAETIITTSVLDTPWVYPYTETYTANSVVVRINSSDVTVAGLTITGDNPNVENVWTTELRDSIYAGTTDHQNSVKSAYFSYNYLETKLGQDLGVDASVGIYVYHNTGAQTKNVSISNCIMSDFWQYTILASQSVQGATHTTITGNSFENCIALPNTRNDTGNYWGHYGQGISASGDVVIADNYFTNLSSGIQAQNNYVSEEVKINNNTFVNVNSGIWLNMVKGNNGLIAELKNNNFSFTPGFDKETSYVTAILRNNAAIAVTSMTINGTSMIIDGNTISDYEFGIQIGNVRSGALLAITNTTFTNIARYCIGMPNTIMGYGMDAPVSAIIGAGNVYNGHVGFFFEVGTAAKIAYVTDENGTVTTYPQQ